LEQQKEESDNSQKIKEEQNVSKSAGMGASSDGQYYPGGN